MQIGEGLTWASCVAGLRAFVACNIYVAQKPESEATYIEHAQLGLWGGVWGHAPPGNF